MSLSSRGVISFTITGIIRPSAVCEGRFFVFHSICMLFRSKRAVTSVDVLMWNVVIIRVSHNLSSLLVRDYKNIAIE